MEILNLNEILERKQNSIPYHPHVYFLIDDQEIVYVGQSVNVYQRIRAHFLQGSKKFTHYFIAECESGFLNDLETAYIQKFKPKYNHECSKGFFNISKPVKYNLNLVSE